MSDPRKDAVAVVVGRFQGPRIHPGQKKVLDFAVENYKHVLVVLGSTGGRPDADNPLPYDVRNAMIWEALTEGRKHFPEFKIAELKDHPVSKHAWSLELDALVESRYPGKEVVMCGSRKSFLFDYSGKHPKVEIPEVTGISGTNERRAIAVRTSADFRAGIIWSVINRRDITYPTVDIAVVNEINERVMLIGKNRDGGKLRFPGGFAEPDDDSYEISASRELSEELPGVSVSSLRYIGSAKIDDRRYRGKDKIKTLLFFGQHESGEPKAGDDADSAEWVPLSSLKEVLIPIHQRLGDMVIEACGRQLQFKS
jgi:bifunctional NMN adenylyltransferase/nudix hydrolase